VKTVSKENRLMLQHRIEKLNQQVEELKKESGNKQPSRKDNVLLVTAILGFLKSLEVVLSAIKEILDNLD
jgi:50S ribosomal subunit-associated GTPase HflX